jgi:pyruvate/2-oxoglutarate dehydrogenase complex dihydrolipoamide dehydrogenase (E3) component
MNAAAYDVLILGSGQGGNPFARAAARAGRRTALVERLHVGGTCVNEGCTPTKTMIASARVAHLGRRARAYGVESGDVRVELARVRARAQGIVDRFRAGTERGLTNNGVVLVRGQARFVGERTVEVTGAGGALTLRAETVVLNTGLRPAIPAIAGLDGIPYLTSTSIMDLTTAPDHLIVLGGGYVGVEFAQMFRRFGSRVTLLQRGDQLLPREDSDVAEEIVRILRDDGVHVVLSASVGRVLRAANGVRIEYEVRASKGGAERGSVEGSHLLVATGRAPNTADLSPDAGGIETDERGYVRVNDRLATSAKGVYAIGDVKGGPAFTHVSYDDFRILQANLLQAGGGAASTAGRQIPYTVFIDPQLGRIGMTEQDARSAGRNVRVARLPMSSMARALETDETRGFMKAVVDADSKHILGASVLGLEGGEIATMLQIAMLGGLPYTVLRDGIFSHPTLSEALNNLFATLDGDR